MEEANSAKNKHSIVERQDQNAGGTEPVLEAVHVPANGRKTTIKGGFWKGERRQCAETHV